MNNDMPPNDDGQIGPISSGLIIDKPWIGFLLDGTKKWEMRSTITNKRGWIGLIPKGSGEVAGIARIVDVGRALTPDEMVATYEQHRIPKDMIVSGKLAKWNTPWVLADVRKLPQTVDYNHPNGAVTFVNLAENVQKKILQQFQ